MSLAAHPPLRNLAELIERLGGVPLDRIRMQPPPGTATVEDVVDIDVHENRLCELVDGVLVEKTMGFYESQVGIVIAVLLGKYVAERDLGVVTGSDGMIRFPGNQVRMPDVAFVSWARFPGGEIPDEAAPEVVPDLAVEVLSPSNSPGEMSRKLREYFDAGVRLVWYVDPVAKNVTAYTSASRRKVFAADAVLDGGKVLPGFQVAVKDLFPAKKGRSARNGRTGKNGRKGKR